MKDKLQWLFKNHWLWAYQFVSGCHW